MDRLRKRQFPRFFPRSASFALAVKSAAFLLAVLLFSAGQAGAGPTTAEQAKNVVMNWLHLEAQPMGSPLGGQIKQVQTFGDAAGRPTYYVVYLNPAGLVFLPADDLVEPIIGFMPGGAYDPSDTNPLGALVNRDITGRVLKARELEAAGMEALAAEAPQAVARRKWTWLEKGDASTESLEFGLPGISDVRVAPFVQSRWNQGTVSGQNCYNYYTPNNYLTGCVATAMAQLMRHWQYPGSPVAGTFTIKVDGVDQSAAIRGGNGSGGNYDWADMVLDPLNSGVNDTQRAAIGALIFDAAISVNTSFTAPESTATMSAATAALLATFRYSNAKFGYNWGSNLPEGERNAMANPNLHARYPVLFGIKRPGGGHAVVCDGYGYNAATMYHHLNLGWGGSDDAWYNLPTIDTSSRTYDSVYSCIYNVYTDGAGEIIAGRVTDNSTTPVPLSGATVTANRTGGGSYITTTNANGTFAITKLPSPGTYILYVTKTGYTFPPQEATTGTSTDWTTTTGNVWGMNFFGISSPAVDLNQALDNAALTFSTSGNANWFGESDTWHYGGSAAQSGVIADSRASRFQTTVTGPGRLTFWYKVSSEKDYDYLDWHLDGALVDGWSGEVDWTLVTLNIPAGNHTVLWVYSKDSSNSVGHDCGWVDKVVYTPAGNVLPALMLLLQ